MTKFSDIPSFILDDYITQVVNKTGEDKVDNSYTYNLFTDANDITWDDSNGIQWDLIISTSYRANTTKSYLKTPGKHIVTRGGKSVSAYAKKDTGFKEIKLYFDEDYKYIGSEYIGEYYTLNQSDKVYADPSDTISYSLSGDHYNFIIYDSFTNSTLSKNVNSQENYEIYVRKDSNFHTWYKNEEYEHYINPNIDFVYLGEMVNSKTTGYNCEIYKFDMDDFFMKSLPVNNRNDNLYQYLKIHADNIFSRTYNMENNLPTLVSPNETYIDFIDSISDNYNLSLPSIDVSDTIREFVRFLPIFLKKKGTYTSIINVWRILNKYFNDFSFNEDIHLYEYWHDKLPDGQYTPNNFDEIYYGLAYGYGINGCAGDSYYHKYPSTYPIEYNDNKILSPHYKVEVDLSCNPYEKNAIISSKMLDNLYYCWEILRPAEKVSHYNVVFSPKVDFSGHNINLYDKKFDMEGNAYWYSTNTFTQELSGSTVYSQNNASSLWTINHTLKEEYPIVKVFDTSLNEIWPSEIYTENNNPNTLYISFDEKVSGYALLTDSTLTKSVLLSINSVLHDLGRTVISQIYNLDNEVEMLENVKYNDSTIEFSEVDKEKTASIDTADEVFEQTVASKEWNIEHNYGISGLMLEIVDDNWNKIAPETITLTDTDNCKVMFDEATTGKVIIKKIGFVNISKDISDLFLSEGCVVRISDEINSLDNPVKTKTISKSNVYKYNNKNLYIDIKLDLNEEFNIKEIGIYGLSDDIMYFYSTGSGLYKHKEFETIIHFRIFEENI